MVLYIDKENLISLVRSEDKAAFSEYAALVRKNLDVQYNFSKEEIKGNEYLTFWFSQFGSGVGGSQDFCPPKSIVPERPMKSNFYNSLDAVGRSSMFFLDDAGKTAAAEAKCCVIVSKVGDELSKLKEIFALEERGEELSYQIADWGQYLPHLPLTDIIICDNHYFKDRYVYEANDNAIIRTLSAIPQNVPVNVIIIVKEGEIDNELDLATEQAKIKSIVKKASGSNQSTVTVLTTYATHDRSLITNYYRVKHGSSFHIKRNSIKHDVSTEVKTHAIRRNQDFTIRLLAEYQNIVDNPSKCIGDKVSNFLKFK